MADSRFFNRVIELYQTSRPILFVLFFAALIVFINSYPNVPGIANEAKDYRQQVKNKISLNDTAKDGVIIKPPEAPSLPNTIAPVISPEEVNEIVNPSPEEPSHKPETGNETNASVPETTSTGKEPPLEIKLLTGFLNVAPLILIAGLGGFGIYLLFKYKKHVTLRSMFGLAIALVAICTIVFIGAITFDFTEFLYDVGLDFNLMVAIILPIAVAIGIWISYCVISKRTTIFRRNMGIAASGGLMGAFLAAFLPFWIVFILLIAIALFDMYSVKYGPIKKILDLEGQGINNIPKKKIEKRVIYRTLSASTSNSPSVETQNRDKSTKELSTNHSGEHNLPANNSSNDEEFDLILMYDNPNWSLGLGDFVIYSMFTSAVLTYCLLYLPYYIFYSPPVGLILPWVIFGICALGLLLGFFITLRLLQKYDYLPGLPITVACGFLVFIICIIILQIINYLLFNEFAIII